MRVLDTLMNLVSGLGTSKDKATAARHVFLPLDQAQIEAAYRSDWVARKIIDIPPHDEVKKGRDWQADKEQIALIEAEEKRIGLWQKVLRARRLARLYGGAALVIGAGQGETSEPLIPSEIGRGGLRYIHAVSRYELKPVGLSYDIAGAFFREPEAWQLNLARTNANSPRIHPSRVIRFIGAEITDHATSSEPYWGDSVLQATMDAVRNVAAAHQGVANLLAEAKLDVIRVPNLMASLASEAYSGRIIQRFELANMMKSSVNALLLDKDEEWDRKQISFADLPEIIDRYMQAAAGAADIPVTRFLSQSPAGLNATGESDYTNYLDRIEGGQELELRPRLEPLDECIIWSALGERPEEIHYKWAPLWQLSEKDAAEVGLKKAQSFKIDCESGILPDTALATARVNQLIEDGVYPGLEAAMADVEPLNFAEGDDPEAPGNDNVPALVTNLRAARAAGRAFGGIAAFVRDAAPRTLYVSRAVLNAREILAWAKGQGFARTLQASDLHVTVCYSRTPIDWMKVEADWSAEKDGTYTVVAGGPRLMERFGDAVVLLFSDWRVMSRHGAFIHAGASHDFDDYQPHITITYDGGDVDLSKVDPYKGPVELGPEIFAEVKDDWSASIEEDET